MRTQAIATLLLAAATQTACTTTFDIPLQHVPALRSGTVVTIDGEEESVSEEHSIKPRPADGVVFVRRDRDSMLFNAYPEGHPMVDKGFGMPALKGPIVMTSDGTHVDLSGPEGTVRLLPGWVQSVQVTQFSPGKTAGLVTGTVLGAAPIITLIAFVASIMTNGFGVSVGCC